MKKLLTVLFLIAALNNKAQIIFENTYPTGSPVKQYLRLVKLSSSGYKYVINDTNSITLYNLNHSLFKSIIMPPRPGGVLNTSALYILYISEQLFNTNPADIEYLQFYTDKSSIIRAHIYDDLGNLLFTKDSAQLILSGAHYGNEEFISYTPAGTKMIIGRQYGGSASVYSLPGFLTCHDCSSGVITSMQTNNPIIPDGKVSNYPNPCKEQTTIEYELPKNVINADIVFYNISGQEVKRFKVTNAFHTILISTEDLESGTYFYQLQTSDGFHPAKKMIVIR